MKTNKDLIKRFAVSNDALDAAVADAMGSLGTVEIDSLYEQSVHDFAPNALIKGKVMRVVNEDVMVDIGSKSEGIVPLFLRRDRALRYMDFLNRNPMLFIGIIVAWNVFDYIFDPVHLAAINLLYPGANYH